MLMTIQAQEPQIAQATVIAIIGASTLVVLALIWLISRFAARTPTDKGPLDYGNFFVVVLGIMTALIGFLVTFPLVVSNVFSEPTQVIALLSALFGTIVGLVGTYFGVKSSSDARQGAQNLASDTISSDTTQPQVSLTNPQDRAPNVPPNTHPSATFSKDMDRASINASTFKLLNQNGLAEVDGRVDYEVPTRVATFIPSNPLQNGGIYEATITAGVRDSAGNALAQDHTWHFTVIGAGP
jgi:hypothetical protein